jgi:hypothetical protein
MKFLVVITLLLVFNANCQIWEEPFDTLPYIDHFERLSGDRVGIRSYTVTTFSDKDSILSYDFYGFDKNGFMIQQFYAMSPNQQNDTNKYHYENGVVQVSDYKREHIYNEQKRLIEIRNSKNDSIWSTNYKYIENKLVEIRYSQQNWSTFQYGISGELQRKEIFQSGKLEEYFNYEHPDEKTLIYQHCLLNDKGNPYLPCEVVEGYYDNEKRLVKIVSKYDLDSNNIFIIEFHFDKNGKIVKMTDVSLNNTDMGAEAIYIRNKIGMLIKIEHYKKGKMYLYSKFDYSYY